GALLLAAGAVFAVQKLTSRDNTSVTQAARDGLTEPSAPPACDSYAVAPRDLWLRDEYGGPLSELEHGQRVRVVNRNNPEGLSYWYVIADDSRQGWTDP